MTMQEMITKYNARSAAHTYALGVVQAHELYAVKLSFEELSRYCKPCKASSKRGGFAKVRIRLSSAERKELIATAEKLGAESLLSANAKYNKGENFERELTERWTAEEWVKDSIPFWQAGDIRVNGVEIQIKLDGAELTNERILGRIA